MLLKTSKGALFLPLCDVCQKLSLSLLYFNKAILHKSSERSSLVTGPGLNSFPPEAKNPGIFHGSATTFQVFLTFLKMSFLFSYSWVVKFLFLLYTLEIRSLSITHIESIFFQAVIWFFTFKTVSQKASVLNGSNLSIFFLLWLTCFMSCLMALSLKVSKMTILSSRNFIMLTFTFRFMMHVEFIFSKWCDIGVSVLSINTQFSQNYLLERWPLHIDDIELSWYFTQKVDLLYR